MEKVNNCKFGKEIIIDGAKAFVEMMLPYSVKKERDEVNNNLTNIVQKQKSEVDSIIDEGDKIVEEGGDLIP